MGNFLHKEEIEKYYSLKEVIGRGTFGKVRRAVRKNDHVQVAVKIIKKKKMTPKDLKGIHDEVEILHRVDHPNVVKMIEIFESEEKLYVVMELLPGGDLYTALTKVRKVSERNAACAIYQAALGLKHIHSMGIAHRDVKPENMLLESKESNNLKIKITDFGLAKYRVDTAMAMKSCCGTPTYVAPEVLEKNGYTEIADIWSLGVTIYILLSGTPPFANNSIPRLYKLIRAGEYDFPEKHWAQISEDAKDLIRKMLVVNPNNRLNIDGVLEHPWIKVWSATQTAHPKTLWI